MLDHGCVDHLFGQVFTLPRYARVDGVIRLNRYNRSVPNSHLEDTLVEAVKSAGSISDDILVVTSETGTMTHDYLLKVLSLSLAVIE
jgi:hypothetical protein